MSALTKEARERLMALCGDRSPHPNDRLVSVSVGDLRALLSDLERAERERDVARASLRAFIGSVEEMTIGVGVPAGLVVTDDGGKTVRVVESRVTRQWYEAIMSKWHRDQDLLVRMYDGYAFDNIALRAQVAKLREAVTNCGLAANHPASWPNGLAARIHEIVRSTAPESAATEGGE